MRSVLPTQPPFSSAESFAAGMTPAGHVALTPALCLLAAFAFALVDAQSPPFCHGLDCPKYSVQDIGDGVELRQYESAVWVSTRVQGAKYGQATRTGFQRLFNYISGQNEAELRMQMTAPVRERMSESGGEIESDFITSFFIPFEYQATAPAPLDPNVYIEKLGPKVYVSSFGGFATEKTILLNANDLHEKLQSKGIDVNADSFSYSGYDSPFALINRHNEIWYVATEDSTISVT